VNPRPPDPDVTADLGSGPAPAPSPAAGRLDAGATLAGRYRIVAPLGKGGMGEVYRADDLELGAPVALKFLPQSLAADPVRLDQLRAEVRTARNVSHPNVCRVFDIATAGLPGAAAPVCFITMEFIDGEDLSSLLRRIGRLPTEKAVEIARQLCLGLAAAHEQRIVHRDLKPANIMLDSRGKARIMDFGVAAAISDGSGGPSATAGTPAYMSPEQAAGEAPTVRSDIFSLGLVLYELFTGKPGLTAKSLADAREFHHSSELANPSTHIADIDPAAERAIMRCLERDPAQRPPSAIAVLTSLPGGDPLAAALAAGETPSPELVAASGGRSLMRPLAAAAWCALTVVITGAIVALMSPGSTLGRLPPAKSREVLADRAREITDQLAPGAAASFTTFAMATHGTFLRSAAAADSVPEKWRLLRERRPGPYALWLRQSPVPLEPTAASDFGISPLSPFPAVVGETLVQVDHLGRLEYFVAVPERTTPRTDTVAVEPDWSRVFQLSGYDLAAMSPDSPERRPIVYSDTIRAWTGSDPAHPDIAVRFVGAAADGKVVYWRVTYPWDALEPAATPAPGAPVAHSRARELSNVAAALGLVTVTGAGVWLCVRNLRLGRGDRATATGAALFLFAATTCSLVLGADRFPTFGEVFFKGRGVSSGLWLGAMFWVFYIALEPHARRRMPHMLIGWNRIFRGHFNDPLVARDVLTGTALGAVAAAAICAFMFAILAPGGFKIDTPSQPLATAFHLHGPAHVTATVLDRAITSVMWGGGSLLAFVLSHIILKRALLACIGVVAIGVLIQLPQFFTNQHEAASMAAALLATTAILRVRGLLAAVTAFFTMFLILMLPVSINWNTPYTFTAFIPAAVIAIMLLYGALVSTGARRPGPAHP